MKWLLLTFLIVLSLSLSAQKSDTTFILRETANDDYHIIYIDHNKNSKAYDWMSDVSMDKDDVETYLASMEFPGENIKNKFKQHRLPVDLPRQWIELHVYKKNWYVYRPNERVHNNNLILTDSTLIGFNMEGPFGNRILKFESIDAKTFMCTLKREYSTTSKVIIHLIDKENQLAVFEHPGEKESRYELMTGIQKIKNYPIVVNESRDKQNEFEFDTPDFKLLLKK